MPLFVLNWNSTAVTTHVRIFADGSSQSTLNEQYLIKHLSLVTNLCVKYPLGTTAADQVAMLSAHMFLLTAEGKCQILMVLPEPPASGWPPPFPSFPFDSIDSVRLLGKNCLVLHSGKNCYQTIPATTCDLSQQQNFYAKYN